MKYKAAKLAEKYAEEISSENLAREMNHIKMVHSANFGGKPLGVWELLNSLAEYIFGGLFHSLCVSLMIFLAAPVTVASEDSKVILHPV